MQSNSRIAPQLNFQRLNPFSRDRKLIRIYAAYDWRNGLGGFLRRQVFVVLAIVFSIMMAGPLPGPGTPPLLILLFLASYPGKRRLLRWLFGKRLFRVMRYLLRKHYRILLVRPRERQAGTLDFFSAVRERFTKTKKRAV